MVARTCKICKKGFFVRPSVAKKGHGNYCSSVCYHESGRGKPPWNKGLHITLKPLTGKIIICKNCGKEKYFQPNQFKNRPCIYCSVKCAGEAKKKNVLVYSSIHARIRKEWGRADVCENCGSNKTVEWANLDYEYDLIREHWRKLCRKCHMRYDLKNGWGKAKEKFPNIHGNAPSVMLLKQH